ncbi:type I restriction-modification enzyme, S subunit [Planobispora rosea]|uniref:Type I restriction-modification enzyme, S subunit n=1 Tax=Planobispora rosea TaxID=35762 RepID=A0A8J3S5Y4_PLARO|nr:restriction endonuclease subunit S [Planobispora rosea]GGS97600.1 type I restriction-modification enzyme, S subunit [Planobispora rosea]GIH87848.1 type I restriction-modification enzyme, S subunit [Planobispora rosea]
MTVRLRHLAAVNPPTPAFERLADQEELTFLPMEAVWPGERLDISRRRTKAEVVTGYTRFQDGDILVPKITPTFEAGRAVLINGLHSGVGAGTTELHVLRPSPRIDPRFLFYAVNTHSFLKIGKSEMYGVAGQQRVPDDFLRNLPVRLPPLEEQRRIADFLDAETARIDRLVFLRARQKDLLVEALMGRAAETTGRVAVRQGTSPGSWGRVPLRRAVRSVQTGSTPAGLRENDSGDVVEGGVMPWYTPAALNEFMSVGRADKAADVAETGGIPVFLPGSILVVGIGESLGKVGYLDHRATGNQQLTALHPAESVDGRFIAWQLWAAYEEIRAWAQYSRIRIINNDVLKSFPIALPPVEVQVAVRKGLDSDKQNLDRLRDAADRFSKLMAERRQALITAAVTGQFDVSSASGRGIEVP